MSRTKDQYHDQMPGPRQTKDEQACSALAEEEHYAEQKRHAANKARQLRVIPVAAPVTPFYAGRQSYPADPATDAQRFETACREADAEARKTGMDIVVFKNIEGQYLTWEEKYISPANPIEGLYTARAKEQK